jgi:hypothetical protein
VSRTPIQSTKGSAQAKDAAGASGGAIGVRSFERRRQAAEARTARPRLRRPQLGPGGSPGALLRRVPPAAWICVAIAILNALAWSLITPPLQGRDEDAHFAYVAQLAETGTTPRPEETHEAFSEQEDLVILGLRYWQTRFTPYTPSISSVAEQRVLTADANRKASTEGDGEAGGAGGAPPFFYALQTIPYTFGGHNILNKLQLMRLFDVLLGGLTALLVFLFLREILPGVPWAATVGAICAALQPQFAFTTATLNPDALIYPLSAGIFLCLARGFRRGLTVRLAVVLGVLITLGLATYFSFIGVAAGALIATLALALARAKAGARRRETLLAPAIVFAIGLGPAMLYALHNALAGNPTFGSASGTGDSLSLGSLWHELSYAWELFLPRLPGMPHYFPGISPWREVWFDRSVGLYGWMDTMFPGWVDNVALVIVGAIAVLCIRALYLERRALRARLLEFAGYAAIVLALLAMLGAASYAGDAIKHEGPLGEPRYLLPLLPLLAALVALAVRGAGRRWIPVLGAALVVVFLGHDLFSQLQTIARYYG